MVDFAQTAKDTFGFGSVSSGNVAQVIIIIVAVVVILGLAIWLFLWKHNQKQYKYTIHVYKRVGNAPVRVGYSKAREIPMGRAGDMLWFVKGYNKFLTPGTIQSAPNEYWYWIREDGEWINFGMTDLDVVSKEAGVKYLHEDMRMQRLATDRLLEQRLMKKNFWEKWGMVIAYVIFFIVLSVAMSIIFYQYGSILDKTDVFISRVASFEQVCKGDQSAELIPAAIGFLIPIKWFRRKQNG